MLTREQIEAATGLFQQMNENKLDVPPAVFTMFGLLLGDAKGATQRVQSDAPVEQAVTTVDVVIRLQVKGSPATVAQYRDALDNLACVMLVQAEDGLWSLGYEDAEAEEGDPPNEFVADFESMRVHAIVIDGTDKLTKDHR